MIVLDTNVVSVMMRSDVDPLVVAWLDRQAAESIWITAVTVFEIRFGLELLAPSRRRRQLEEAFIRSIEEDFECRVLPLDDEAAQAAATRAASQQKAGKTIDFRDLEIASIVASRRATLATRNTRHFEGLEIELVDPWRAI